MLRLSLTSSTDRTYISNTQKTKRSPTCFRAKARTLPLYFRYPAKRLWLDESSVRTGED